MTFEAILPLILKVLGCAVGIYILAGFLVSITKLLPFLAILSSVGTIMSISYVLEAKNEELLWIPLVLSLATQLFYKGKDYMNPKIHENIYTLVKVERKWNSIFADFDDYELHFSPYETGGFIENTIFLGIFFGLYYNFLLFPTEGTWIVYIIPVYFLLMSVVDALGVLKILRLTPFFYGALRILICIGAVTICLLGGASGTGGFKTDPIYKQAKDLVVFDYDNVSYSAYYDVTYYSGSSSAVRDEYSFLYDSKLDVGAEYRSYSSGEIYDYIYVTDKSPEGEAMKLKDVNPAVNTYEWLYVQTATENDTALKYHTTDIMPDFAPYLPLTKEKVDNTKTFERDSYKRTYSIVYNSEYDSTYDKENDLRYYISYNFRTDKDGNLIKFLGFYCQLFTDKDTMHTLIYSVLDNETGLSSLYSGKTLKNASYGESLIFGIDFDAVIDEYVSDASILDGDGFILYQNATGDDALYFCDATTGIVGVYGHDSYYTGVNAMFDNDFVTYKPDFYVSNETKSIYDAEMNLIATDNKGFKKWTFDNADATFMLTHAFDPASSERISASEGAYSCTVTLIRTVSGFENEVYIEFSVSQNTDLTYSLGGMSARSLINGKYYTIAFNSNRNNDLGVTLP